MGSEVVIVRELRRFFVSKVDVVKLDKGVSGKKLKGSAWWENSIIRNDGELKRGKKEGRRGSKRTTKELVRTRCDPYQMN